MTRTENTSSAIAYNGSWTLTPLTGASGGSVQMTSVSTSTAKLTWTGTALKVVMTKGPNMGIVRISVGRTNANIDLYAPTLQAQQVVYTRQNLSNGSYTVTVRPTGTKNAASTGTAAQLDAFDTD